MGSAYSLWIPLSGQYWGQFYGSAFDGAWAINKLAHVTAQTTIGQVISEVGLPTVFDNHQFPPDDPIHIGSVTYITPQDIFSNPKSLQAPTVDGATITAKFTPTVKMGGVDFAIPLSEAASICGVDHFNWKQTVTPFGGVLVYADADANASTAGDRIGVSPIHIDPIVNTVAAPATRYLLLNTDSALSSERKAIVKYQFVPDGFPYYLQENSSGIMGVNNSGITTVNSLKFEDSPKLPVFFDSDVSPPDFPPSYTYFETELVGVMADGSESPVKTGIRFTWKSNARYFIDPSIVAAGGALAYESTPSSGSPSVIVGGVFDVQVFQVPEPASVLLLLAGLTLTNFSRRHRGMRNG